MELLKEILAHALAKEGVTVSFTNLSLNVQEIVELHCYKALREIKTILADDSLTDEECFLRIERIVCVFEEIGSSGDNRHDFG